MSISKSSPHGLTVAQREVFDKLLAVGSSRPLTPPALASELQATLEKGCSAALSKWPEGRLWLSKGQISTIMRCEGAALAQADQKSEGFSSAIAVGVVSHRAIQIAHTHPHLTPAATVDAAIEASRDDEKFSLWWDLQSAGVQSDLLCQMVSRAVGFLDAFPPLLPNWIPRFEESIQARIGGLVLSTRPDLVLGRPRADMRQTMFLCDFKTGSLSDNHEFEAMFYALVATLRFGVAPFRSTVFSLASGDWTDPDVSADKLRNTADQVVSAVNSYIDIMLDRKTPEYSPDRWCSWCPARSSCPALSDKSGSDAALSTDVVVSKKPAKKAPLSKKQKSVFDID